MLAKILFLALAWAAMTGEPTLENLVFGAALGYATLRATRKLEPWRPRSLRKLPQLASLTAYFLWQLLLANIRMAAAVLGDPTKLRPAFIEVPLSVESDAEITQLANLITLTPGTLSIDVSTDHRVLYVHVVDCPDPDATRDEIKRGFERRVKELYA